VTRQRFAVVEFGGEGVEGVETPINLYAPLMKLLDAVYKYLRV